MQSAEQTPINGTNHAIDDEIVTNAETDEAERSARLRERVRGILAATGLTQKALAETIDCKRTTFANWLSGAYARSVPGLEAKVEEWLREHDSDQAGEIEFVETPTAMGIVTALAHAQANGDMACVYGAPGVGKTRAIEHYAKEFENVWVVTARKSCATLVPALERVAAAVGVHDLMSGAARLSRAIENRVRDTHGLIVIDEAQHLGLDAVEELRAIHDETGTGLALVGNQLVYARLTGGSRVVHFAQLFSRIGMKMHIPHARPEDIGALIDRWDVRDRKARELLMRVARKPGALRSIVKILKLASIGGSAITAERVRAAMAHLGSEDA